MYRLEFMFAAVFGICIIGQPSWAERAYVTDTFEVTFRSGPSTQNKIMSLLSSGQPVTVLERQGDWSRIRPLGKDEESEEGWVMSRYLISRQPWELQAAELRKANSHMQGQVKTLKEKLEETESVNNELTAKLDETSRVLKQLGKDHRALKQGAAQYLQLAKTHKETEAKLGQMRQGFEELHEKYQRLRYSERNVWFATGAGILLAGVGVGIIIGRREKRRRSSYY
jgi:SH3 domain protein